MKHQLTLLSIFLIGAIARVPLQAEQEDTLANVSEKLVVADREGEIEEALQGVALLKGYFEVRRIYRDHFPEVIGEYKKACRIEDRCRNFFGYPTVWYRTPNGGSQLEVILYLQGFPDSSDPCEGTKRKEPETVDLSGFKGVLLTDKGMFATSMRLCVSLPRGAVELSFPLPGDDIDGTKILALRTELRRLGKLVDYKKIEEGLLRISQ